MTLRRKILLAVVLVAGAGLVAADIALYVGVRSYLYGQIDNELLSLSNSPGHALGSACSSSSINPNGGGGGNDGGSIAGLPENSWVAFASGGQLLCHGFLISTLDSSTPAPHLPSAFGSAPGATRYGTYFGTSSSGKGGTSYQMAGFAGSASSGFGESVNGVLIVAIPTASAEATLGQIGDIELIATLAVLVALAILAWSIIRFSLRPLEDMTKTADAIAAGNLSQRVPTRNARAARTEVGRLGAALNAMLGHIETAFAARERSEAKLRRFVADASHELRTPLTSIRGYAELFRRGAANRPEDLANSMRRIEEESARMGVLVEDLLQLARLDIAAAEQQSLEMAPVDLATLATDAVSDQRAADPERPVTLYAEPALVRGDEGALRQVIANLLANASHHTAAGTAITVRTGTSGARGGSYVEVADSGSGMSSEQAAHVFERFWRADPARTRGHSGAGLGLSIVAAITAAHKGTVSVDASPGRGCLFRVVLPSATDDGAGPGATKSAAPEPVSDQAPVGYAG